MQITPDVLPIISFGMDHYERWPAPAVPSSGGTGYRSKTSRASKKRERQNRKRGRKQ